MDIEAKTIIPAESDPLSLHLDQTTPQEVINVGTLPFTGVTLTGPSDPTGTPSAAFNLLVSSYVAEGHSHQYRIYPYIDYSGTKVFSANYIETSAILDPIAAGITASFSSYPSVEYDVGYGYSGEFSIDYYCYAQDANGIWTYSGDYSSFYDDGTNGAYRVVMAVTDVGATKYAVYRYDYGTAVTTYKEQASLNFVDNNDWSVASTSQPEPYAYGVDVSWDAVAGVDGYVVLKEDTGWGPTFGDLNGWDVATNSLVDAYDFAVVTDPSTTSLYVPATISADNLTASALVQALTFKSTVATGTKPLDIASTTLNTNLNADLLDGSHASAFQVSGNYVKIGAGALGNRFAIWSGTDTIMAVTDMRYSTGGGYFLITGLNGLGTDGKFGTSTAGNTQMGSFHDKQVDFLQNNTTVMSIISRNLVLSADNRKAMFGVASDCSIYYDGTNMIINPKEVGTGLLSVLGNISASSITGTTLISSGDIYTSGAGDDLWLGTATQANANFRAYATGEVHIDADNIPISFGEGQDADIYYDGTNLVINPKVVGTGCLSILGDFGIGTYIPTQKFNVNTDGAGTYGAFSSFGDTATFEGSLYLLRGRGTQASPSVVLSGDTIGSLRFAGQKQDNVQGQYTTCAKIEAKATGDYSDVVTPGLLNFYTTPQASSTPLVRMTIADTGNVLIGTTTDDGVNKLQVAGGVFINNQTTAPLEIQGGQGSYPTFRIKELLYDGVYSGSRADWNVVNGDVGINAYDDVNSAYITFTFSGNPLILNGSGEGNVLIGTATDDGVNKLQVSGSVSLINDNDTIKLGAANDATITFDGDSLNIVANAVTAADALELTGGTIKTTGGLIGSITNATDTYTILYTDETVICNKATAFTVTLPTAVVGQKFTIKNINTGLVTIDGDSTDTIDDTETKTLSQWDSMTIQCNVANKWVII